MKQLIKSRLLRWIICLLGVCVILLGIGILIALRASGPTHEEVRALVQKYEAVRTRFPDTGGIPADHTNPSRPIGAVTHATTATQASASRMGETDQERCDRLFLKLIHQHDPEGDDRELPHAIPPSGFYEAQRQELHELAGFYETGIRVSEAARREFKLPYGRLLGSMIDTILNYKTGTGFRQDRILLGQEERGRENEGKLIKITPEQAERIIEALRFLRVTQCPAFSCDLPEHTITVNWLIRRMLDNGGKEWTAPPPLPKQIETMPLELLSPREADGYSRFLGQLADMEREYVAFCTDQTDPAQFFKSDWQKQKYWLSHNHWGWQDPLYRAGGFCQSIFDTVVNHRTRVMYAQQSMRQGETLLDYITHASNDGSVENVDDLTFYLLSSYNDQIEARALAAALELRQGRAVPSPGSVIVDSYFFDTVTRKPMLMFRSAAGPGMTRLYLAWPLRPPAETAKGIGIHGRYNISVLLPAGHPGLATVPELEPAKTRTDNERNITEHERTTEI